MPFRCVQVGVGIIFVLVFLFATVLADPYVHASVGTAHVLYQPKRERIVQKLKQQARIYYDLQGAAYRAARILRRFTRPPPRSGGRQATQHQSSRVVQAVAGDGDDGRAGECVTLGCPTLVVPLLDHDDGYARER
jgi:hypothetical protein